MPVQDKYKRRAYKEGIEGESNDISRKGDAHDIDLDIRDGHLESGEDSLSGGILVDLTDILKHAELSDLELLGSKATRVGWEIGQDENGGDGEEHGDCTLDPKQPPPRSVSQNALHVRQHTSADEGGKGIRDKVAAEENGVPRCELPSRVPL